VTGQLIVGRFGSGSGSGSGKRPEIPSEDALREDDRAARKEAQRRFYHPLILEAGAGTGKTTTLIGRLLAWTLGVGWQRVLDERAARPAARPALKPEGEASPERTAADVLRGVVAITFTEAAAAEMAARAAQELGALAAGGPLPDWLDAEVFPPLPEVARRARALLGALDHLAVRTIHAFCLGLLAEHPLEAGVHPRLQVDAEGRLLEEVVGEVVDASLCTGYGTPGDPDLLALAVRGIGPQEIIEALIALAQAGLPAAALEKDPLGPEPVRAFGVRLAAACEAVHGLLAPRLAGPAGRIRNARAVESGLGVLIERLRSAGGEGLTIETLRSWIDELLPANLTEHLRKWGKGKPSQTEQSLLGDALAGLTVGAGDLGRLVEHLRCIDPELLGAARRALAPLLAAVQRELRSRGIATFDSLLTGARDLLASHAEVRARVRRSIDQLLVDEFQDTDAVQCEILRWIALDGPRGELPGLFLVGDPKQSIYGWRSADLRAYEGFVERVKRHGGEVMSLVENFRSVPAILAEVARVIEPVMVYSAGLQPRFEPLLACERRRSAPEIRRGGRAAVEHWVSWKKEENGGRGRMAAVETAELEASALAADVRSLHRDEAVPWKEIAVLLRSTGDLDTYLEALRRARVPFVVGRDKQYYRRREIIEAAALVRAVIDPGDHLALLTVLRSALVGVPDAALIPLWQRDFPRRVTELIPGIAGAAKLEALRTVVAEAARELAVHASEIPGLAALRGWEQGLLAALEHLALLRASFDSETADVFVERLRRLFLPEAVEAARYLGPYRLANLDRFFRQLLTAVENGGGDLTSILRALRRSIAEAREAEEGRPQEGAEDAVQVMTIHGAKGLDFQHVYLVQLHKPPRGDAGPRTEVGRLEGGGVGGIEVRLFGAPTLGYDQIAAERARVEAAERVRTLYVAMTRAKDRLVLAAAWPEEPEVKSSEQARTHLDLLLARHDRPAEPLAVLWERSLGEGEPAAFADPAGALWKFPALGPARGMDDDAEAAGPDLPSPDEVARASAALRADRLAAAAHSARRFGGAASEEAHELLRQQLAERRLSDEPAPAPQFPAGDSSDREAAMAAGGAVHRALEEWDLAVGPQMELERQRRLLRAYLTPLAGGDALERALPRAAELLEHFAASGLLRRLLELRDSILARELPVLIPPGDGPHAPVGVVTGAIDLLYRDPATGEIVIADYKTDETATAADLDRRAAAYAPQGAAYMRAIQEALELKKAPRFELWFLRADRVVPVGRERT
jgi:ATP-dependent helicase/nuclease subunit A